MQERSEVKPWKNREKGQKGEKIKPAAWCVTEETTCSLMRIDWNSKVWEMVNCLRTGKNPGNGKKKNIAIMLFPIFPLLKSADSIY